MSKNFLDYLSRDKRSIILSFVLVVFICIFLFFIFTSLNLARGMSSTNSSVANLTIWDQTDARGGSISKFTNGTLYSKTLSNYNVYFFANFTNFTSNATISAGLCIIRFKENMTETYNGWKNMPYNATADAFVYNRSFNYKGNLTWQVNCSEANYLPEINTTDTVSIRNTRPFIIGRDPEGQLGTQSVTEDINFTYNLASIVSEDDFNDIPSLSFSVLSINTTLKNYTLTSAGLLTVNISTNADATPSSQNFGWQVIDTGSTPDSAVLPFTLTQTNDPPVFSNLNDTSMLNENEFFNFTLAAVDEENNIPFYFNVTFINCTTANWSTRNSTNCGLFNLTNYTSTSKIINFTPSNNDIGNYTIEFNVTDAGNTLLPYNATRTKTVIFSILNVNDPPVIGYSCNNENTTQEDTLFSCVINASDQDESYNITFATNETLFTFNNTRASFTANVSGFIAESNLSFVTNDSFVGMWKINVTATDSSGGVASRVISLNISNVNDSVALSAVNNSYEAHAVAVFSLAFNASDDDLRISQNGKTCTAPGCYNEVLTFNATIRNLTGGTGGVNTTLFNIVTTSTSRNTTKAWINFTSSNSDSGNYTINITVHDANNYSLMSRKFNLSIYNNTSPFWRSPLQTNFTISEGGTFSINFSSNVSDAEDDAITFSNDSDFVDISSTGLLKIFPINNNDSNVGNHTVAITITDAKGAINSSQQFTFRIANVNETPKLYRIFSSTNATEGSVFNMTFSGDDEDLDLTTNYGASDYYSENLVWTINSTNRGFTAERLSFIQINNKTAMLSFTPNSTEVGSNIVNITINDSTGRMASQQFTLNVSSIPHFPILDPIGPRNITVNQTFYLDLNATHIDDGADNVTGNTNFTFASNATWFSIGANDGVINLTLVNNSRSGYYSINISVNDSSGRADSEVFRLTIFTISVPPEIAGFIPGDLSQGTVEDCSTAGCPYRLLFGVDATDQNSGLPNNETLTYVWNVDGVANKTVTGVVPGTWQFWNFDTTFTDEGVRNVTVNITDTANLTVSHSWNVTVNHTNAPVIFSGSIKPINATQSGTLSLTRNFGDGTIEGGGHFYDADNSDPLYNQSLNLTLNLMDSECNSSLSSSNITILTSNDTLSSTFSTTSSSLFCLNITAVDSTNASMYSRSNNFQVNLTVNPAAVVETPTPTTGGGGGGSSTKKTPLALKIIVPEPFSMFTNDKIIVPIKIQNMGQIDLSKIHLSARTTLEGVQASLNQNFFEKLAAGKEEKLDLEVSSDSNSTGAYEIIINASVESPSYTDSASFFVNLVEIGWTEKVKAQEQVVFLEELLIGNPECLELTEFLNQAKKEMDKKNFDKALDIAGSAIQACKSAVTSKGRSVEVKRTFDIVGNAVILFTILLLVFLLLIFILHSYQRAKFRKGAV